MSDTFDSLSDDEVRKISLLVETLDRSTFDYLQVNAGNLKVTIGKGNAPHVLIMDAVPNRVEPDVQGASPQPPVATPQAGTPVGVPLIVTAHPSAQVVTNEKSAQDQTVEIVAPMMGRFYARPEPGAAPFVAVGDVIAPDTTLALIEIMKVFTAVRANVTGVITEICVQDTQFVEYEHVLFKVRVVSKELSVGLADTNRAPK